MLDWIKLILYPGNSLGIPQVDCHKFQIFASVACDILWFYRNKAFHDGTSFDARNISAHINKISLEHFQAWHSTNAKPVEKWIPPAPNWVKINFDTAIRELSQLRQPSVVILMVILFTCHLQSIPLALLIWVKPWQLD
jgi:hypothetical protein